MKWSNLILVSVSEMLARIPTINPIRREALASGMTWIFLRRRTWPRTKDNTSIMIWRRIPTPAACCSLPGVLLPASAGEISSSMPILVLWWCCCWWSSSQQRPNGQNKFDSIRFDSIVASSSSSSSSCFLPGWSERRIMVGVVWCGVVGLGISDSRAISPSLAYSLQILVLLLSTFLTPWTLQINRSIYIYNINIISNSIPI